MIDLDTLLGRFSLYETGTITRALRLGQWWDAHLKPILDEVPSGGWAIDIGAHVGWFTRYLSHRFRVVAVEPNPETFQLLTQNNYGDTPYSVRVQCWPVAAYHQVATLSWDLRNDRTDAGACAFTPTNGLYTVPAVPLDHYLLAHAHVSVIKCDAQGADLRALKGLRQTIARCRPLIVFEWEEGMAAWQGDTWQDYLDFFQELNYTVERITLDYWDYVARPR